MSEPRARTIQAVKITCSILEVLQELNGAGITELANYLEYSKSTIFSHLTTLEECRLVVKEDSEYRLSLRFLDIGSHVRDQFNNYSVIKEELDNLAAEINEVAQFGIEEHGKVSYLYKETGSQGVVTASSVGTNQPMHSTSLGKSILAHMPDTEVKRVLDQWGLPEQTENTITERDELFTELEEVRKQGYAKDDQENVIGLRCIGAPVIGKDGIFGAVSVSGPSSRINDQRFDEELPTAVKSAANVIELNSKFG